MKKTADPAHGFAVICLMSRFPFLFFQLRQGQEVICSRKAFQKAAAKLPLNRRRLILRLLHHPAGRVLIQLAGKGLLLRVIPQADPRIFLQALKVDPAIRGFRQVDIVESGRGLSRRPAKHPAEAKAFLDYLTGPEASAVFEGVGFSPMAK